MAGGRRACLALCFYRTCLLLLLCCLPGHASAQQEGVENRSAAMTTTRGSAQNNGHDSGNHPHLWGLKRLADAYRHRHRTSKRGGIRSDMGELIHEMMHKAVGRLRTDNIVKSCLIAVNVTSIFVEHTAANMAMAKGVKDPVEIKDQLIEHMSEVADDIEALAAVVMRNPVFRRFVPKELPGIIQDLVDAGAVPRLVLATSAAVLHDWAPREDSCVALLVVVFASGSLTKQLASNLLTSLEAEMAEEHGVSGLLGGGVLSDAVAELWHTQEDNEQEQRIGHRLFRLFSVLGGGVGLEEGQEGREGGVVVGRRSREGAAMTALLRVVRVVRKVRWRPMLASAVLGAGALGIVGPLVHKGRVRVQEGRKVEK